MPMSDTVLHRLRTGLDQHSMGLTHAPPVLCRDAKTRSQRSSGQLLPCFGHGIAPALHGAELHQVGRNAVLAIQAPHVQTNAGADVVIKWLLLAHALHVHRVLAAEGGLKHLRQGVREISEVKS